jgi:hypothetical protein
MMRLRMNPRKTKTLEAAPVHLATKMRGDKLGLVKHGKTREDRLGNSIGGRIYGRHDH